MKQSNRLNYGILESNSPSTPPPECSFKVIKYVNVLCEYCGMGA